MQEVVSNRCKYAERVGTDCAFPAEAVDLRRTGLLGLVLAPPRDRRNGFRTEWSHRVVAQLSAACGSTAMIYLMHMALPQYDSRVASTGVCRIWWLWLPENNSAPYSSENRVLVRTSLGARVTSADGDSIAVADKKLGDLGGVRRRVYGVRRFGRRCRRRRRPLRGNGHTGPAGRHLHRDRSQGMPPAPMTVDIRIPDSYRREAGSEIRHHDANGTALVLSRMRLYWVGDRSHRCRGRHIGTARLGTSVAAWPSARSRSSDGHHAGRAKAYLGVAASSVFHADDTTLTHVLGVEASVNDAALTITESTMRVCGGGRVRQTSAHRTRPSATPRRECDSAIHSDALYGFYGRAVTRLPLF